MKTNENSGEKLAGIKRYENVWDSEHGKKWCSGGELCKLSDAL